MYTIRAGRNFMLAHSRAEILAALRQRLDQAESPTGEEFCSSGCPALDQLLPGGGFRRGSLVEWCAAIRGSGAGVLALLAAREACRGGGALLVWTTSSRAAAQQPGCFYPPAVMPWGLDLGNLLLVRPRNKADELWALDQALRCPAVAAVWGSLQELDGRTFRRLQLAAEKGHGLGLLLRPASAQGRPSWADVRLLVQPLASSTSRRRLRVEVLRCRGGRAGAKVEIELDEAQGTIHEAHRQSDASYAARGEAG
jgi:protein ImuA